MLDHVAAALTAGSIGDGFGGDVGCSALLQHQPIGEGLASTNRGPSMQSLATPLVYVVAPSRSSRSSSGGGDCLDGGVDSYPTGSAVRLKEEGRIGKNNSPRKASLFSKQTFYVNVRSLNRKRALTIVVVT